MKTTVAVLAIALCAIITTPSAAEQSAAPAELYHVQLKNVTVPRSLLLKVLNEKGSKAVLVDTRLYVEVCRNGTAIYRSPALVVEKEGKQEQFNFPQDNRETSFALMWKPSDEVFVSVKVAENKALVKASTAGAGGLAGAAAGAGIGAVGAGVCSGGLGAPVGALIGAAIGFFGGGAIGAAVPVAGAREVVSFIATSDRFGLDGKLEKDVGSSDDDVLIGGKASIQLKGGQRLDAVAQNGLQLQKKYVVRLRSVSISSKAPKFKENEKYYMLVSLSGEDKPLKIDLPNLRSANIINPMENTIVLKNVGGESSVEIRRKSVGRDPLVFKAMQGATNGSSWVFIGKSYDDSGSFVEFDTFPVED